MGCLELLEGCDYQGSRMYYIFCWWIINSIFYRIIKTVKDHQKLQADLEQLEIWAKDWGVRFNAKKCYIPEDRLCGRGIVLVLAQCLGVLRSRQWFHLIFLLLRLFSLIWLSGNLLATCGFCLLFHIIKTAKDHQKLQADLEQLEIWANNWGMRFNAKKCYIYYPSTKNRINSTLLIITSFKKFKTTHT
jgi:hypothetical protein